MDKYKDTLLNFDKQGIQYIVIGTWALKRLFPKEMFNYKIKDCDIITNKSINNINTIIEILKNNKWKIYLWDKEIKEKLKHEEINNKYYIRALKDGYCIDITYECDFFSWEELYKNSFTKSEIHYASLDHILFLKRKKGRANDLEIIKRIEHIYSTIKK